ncbi:transposase [Marinomonas aquiplantarum]|uniref:transposase n=1 Tax=Marinomonas aquiplantarum TaxID=491951 RepID=UPI003CCC696D
MPAYSPDLNPNEYLNGDLKSRLRNSHPAKNEDELQKTVRSHVRMLQENPERGRRYFHHPKIGYAA